LLLVAVVGAAVAVEWQFELVDTLGSRTDPQFTAAPGGVLHFCYFDGQQRRNLVHSFFDSTWHRELPGFPEWLSDWDMDAGRHGEVGLALTVTAPSYQFWERQAGVWSSESVPIDIRDTVFLSFDSGGAPAIVFGPGSGSPDRYVIVRRQDSAWVAETALVSSGSRYLEHFIYTFDNRPCLLVQHYEIAAAYGLELYAKDGDSWPMTELVSGWRGMAAFMAWAARPDSGVTVCYSISDEATPDQFRLKEPGQQPFVLESTWVSAAAMTLDELARPHIAYVLRDTLVCVWEDDQLWHRSAVKVEAGLALAGVAQVGHLPVIGFVGADNRVWVARARPSAVEESRRPQASSHKPEPTVVRGVLFLPRSTSASLLNAAGRRVLDLRAGANDAGALAPGVYFVREEPQASSLRPQAIRKVVVAE
jgi:hypothetical protein